MSLARVASPHPLEVALPFRRRLVRNLRAVAEHSVLIGVSVVFLTPLLWMVNGTRWNQLMAVAVVMTIPVVILFFLAQRFFMRGIAMTGITGR